MVQVFAHLREQAKAIASAAKEFDSTTARRATKTLDTQVERGTKLLYFLRMPGLVVDKPDQHLIWRGEPESVQFIVRIPANVALGTVAGTIVVTQDSVPIGHISFLLTVVLAERKHHAQTEPQLTGSCKRYHEAFISYASKDRPEVLKRVQMLDRVNIRYFHDLLS